MRHNNNPFLPGKPVPSEQLKGRDNLIRRIVNNIFKGQSTIIVGPFRSGKTSILNYLSDSNKRNQLYEEKSQNVIFSSIDVNEIFDGQCNKNEFWLRVLEPLEDKITNNPALDQAYKTCQEKNFSTDSLDKLLKQMEKNFQLVLMLDEFHVLLQHPTLGQGDFFASLRTLASLNGQALTLVMTSNILLSRLNEDSKEYTRNPTGSPYFNFMDEEALKTLSSSAVDELLGQDKKHFNDEDRQFIKNMTGGYPYFLQVAASELWELYEDEPKKDAGERRKQAQQKFYDKVEDTLENIWQSWPSKTQKAFASLFANTPEPHSEEIQNKLKELERYGFVGKTGVEKTGDWKICSHVWKDFVRKQLARKNTNEVKNSSESHFVSESEKADEVLNNLWKPTFLILMLIGTFVGNGIGVFLITNGISLSDPLFVYIIKFVFASVGAFFGYQIAKKLDRIGKSG